VAVGAGGGGVKVGDGKGDIEGVGDIHTVGVGEGEAVGVRAGVSATEAAGSGGAGGMADTGTDVGPAACLSCGSPSVSKSSELRMNSGRGPSVLIAIPFVWLADALPWVPSSSIALTKNALP
jgi:hypothetical protein